MHTVIPFMISVLGADPPGGATAPAALSVWDFARKGGPTMIVIALCSLVALSVIVERLLITRRRAVIPAEFMPALKAADQARAVDLCRASGSPIANILLPAVRHRNDSLEATQKAVSEAGRREIVRLRHRMRLLGALPQVSTMLGLLGTILGMIKTFQAVAASGQSLGKTELLARGIFEAWANTAAGLLVAIPVLIAYHALLGRMNARSAELDRIATDWIEDQRPVAPASVITARIAEPAQVNGTAAAVAVTA